MEELKKCDTIKADKVILRIAESANYLKSKGFDIYVKNGDIDFTEQLEQEIFHL